MSVRTITLKLLREGPTHNHLLSPLTPYLAVVGQYEAVSLRVPYEHRRLLRDLNALRYGATASRAADVSRISPPDRRLIADDVSEILAAVPGLTAEMSPQNVCHPQLTHLCLEFSAAELSLVPFEIATSPRGFPGEGSPLSVQPTAPIVMTRCIPGAPGRRCRWGGRPRVLFIAAQPPGFPEVPLIAHLVALVKALQPWSGAVVDEFDLAKTHPAALEDWLTVRPRATLADIEEACRSQQYTHVHVLAHSEVVEEAGQSQFALALHGLDGGKELVSAERLQAAMRIPLARPMNGTYLSHPLVVSLATCDSGNPSQVVFPAMSLAHALHAAGVPLVVGSLFPLSTHGSAVLVDTLYTGLLRGRDPRWVLHDVRQDLFRAGEQTHDWGSMVAYASFSDAFDEQVIDASYAACCAAIAAAIKGGDRMVAQFEQSAGDDEPAKTEKKERTEDATTRQMFASHLEAIANRVDDWAKDMPQAEAYGLEGRGMLASGGKKLSALFFRGGKALGFETDEGRMLLERSRAALASARDRYRDASRMPRWASSRPSGQLPSLHWVLTQALSLQVILDGQIDWEAWWAAVADAKHYLQPTPGRAHDIGDETWAHGSLAELFLLAHAINAGGGNNPADAPVFGGNAEAKAQEHLRSLIGLALGTTTPGVYLKSTREQFERYTNWWCTTEFFPTTGPVRNALRNLATTLIAEIRTHKESA